MQASAAGGAEPHNGARLSRGEKKRKNARGTKKDGMDSAPVSCAALAVRVGERGTRAAGGGYERERAHPARCTALPLPSLGPAPPAPPTPARKASADTIDVSADGRTQPRTPHAHRALGGEKIEGESGRNRGKTRTAAWALTTSMPLSFCVAELRTPSTWTPRTCTRISAWDHDSQLKRAIRERNDEIDEAGERFACCVWVTVLCVAMTRLVRVARHGHLQQRRELAILLLQAQHLLLCGGAARLGGAEGVLRGKRKAKKGID